MDLIESFIRRYCRPSTRLNYEADLRLFSGDASVTPENLENVFAAGNLSEYRRTIAHGPFKPATILRRQAVLRAFLKWANDESSFDLADSIDALRRTYVIPPRSRSPASVLTSAQVDTLLRSVLNTRLASTRDYAILVLIVDCGLRRAEVSQIHLADIDRSPTSWIIHLKGSRGGGRLFVRLSDRAKRALENVIATYGIDHGAIFRSLSANSRGRQLSARSIHTIVARAASRSGIGHDFSADTLRYIGCVNRLKAGASIQQVQTHARHKNIETTMMYVHQRDRLRDSAADYIHIKKS